MSCFVLYYVVAIQQLPEDVLGNTRSYQEKRGAIKVPAALAVEYEGPHPP